MHADQVGNKPGQEQSRNRSQSLLLAYGTRSIPPQRSTPDSSVDATDLPTERVPCLCLKPAVDFDYGFMVQAGTPAVSDCYNTGSSLPNEPPQVAIPSSPGDKYVSNRTPVSSPEPSESVVGPATRSRFGMDRHCDTFSMLPEPWFDSIDRPGEAPIPRSVCWRCPCEGVW